MSAMIALLLVLSTLAGCASETLVNVKTAHAPPPPALVYSVEIEEFEDVLRDEDGTELAVCSYALPVLRAAREDGTPLEGEWVPEAVQTFNDQFSSWRNNAQALVRHAREDHAVLGGSAVYSDELQCTVYQTERLVSVAGVYYTYTGGAHPNTILMSWNFDLESGTFFDPGLLDEETGLAQAVHQALIQQAEARAKENGQAVQDFYWEDYAAILENWRSYAVSFDSTGMSIGFSPYELACYAAGPQVFQIPYEDLVPYLGGHGRALLGME